MTGARETWDEIWKSKAARPLSEESWKAYQKATDVVYEIAQMKIAVLPEERFYVVGKDWVPTWEVHVVLCPVETALRDGFGGRIMDSQSRCIVGEIVYPGPHVEYYMMPRNGASRAGP